jgi:pilus assembly protein CpaB
VSSRRTLILVGAIALGLVAALLLFNYVRGIEDRANNNAKRVDVYVAKTDIPRGTPGETAASDGAIGTAKIPQEFRPASAITTTDEIQKKVALFNIPQNTPIVQDMFVDPAQTQISFRQRLKNPDHVAITVSVDQVHGVAGFLVPGDEVNLMVKFDNQGSSDVGASLKSTMRYLYQKVQILAVGQSTLLSPGEQTSTSGTTTATASSGLLTFNVPPEAAAWIASAQESGGLYLSLVAEDYTPKPLPPIDPNNVTELPGENPAQLTPYGPTGNQD